jgi:putative endopeptidase
VLSVVVAVVIMAIASRRDEVRPPEPSEIKPAWASIVAEVNRNMDKSVDPCDDFYQYSCGGWLKNTELPGDRASYGRFTELSELNTNRLKSILESNWPMLGRFYQNCMDETQIETLGLSPLAPLLDAINSYKNSSTTLEAVLSLFHSVGVRPLFNVYTDIDTYNPSHIFLSVDQGGMTLPSKDYYYADRYASVRQVFSAHIRRMLVLLNDPSIPLDEASNAIYQLEMDLANGALTRAERRGALVTYHPMPLTSLRDLVPNFNWDNYFSGLGVSTSNLDVINVAVPAFFGNVSKVLTTTSADKISWYLTFRLLSAHGSYLTAAVRNEKFTLSQAITGVTAQPPRWKFCSGASEDYLGELVGRYFVLQYFSSDALNKSRSMIGRIEEAFSDNIQSLEWMDEQTKTYALQKLNAFINKIGHPDKWTDYSSIELQAKQFYQNVFVASKFGFDLGMSALGKPADKSMWLMLPQEVNAYYNPPWNEIVFPAGILQPPFFSDKFPTVMNFGGIGTVIGHELTHGFDDEGRRYDSTGNLTNWWTANVAEKFEQKAKCVSDLYSSYEVEPGLNVNGDLTLGENIADMGGLKESFKAWKNLKKADDNVDDEDDDIKDSFGLKAEQLFFVTYAQIWCRKQTEEYSRLQVTTDPHSPANYRVLGPLSNSEDFSKAFECKSGSRMNPQSKCTVW